MNEVVAAETQERLDRALAWVVAARSLQVLGGEVFLMGDCLYVEQLLEDAGSRPAAVEVQEGLAPQVSVARAEDELDGIDPGQRPVLLLPARAELRSLAARLPDVGTAD